MNKYCQHCKNLLIKRYKESHKQWNVRKFCNRKCSANSLFQNESFLEKSRVRMMGNTINNGRKHICRKSPPTRPQEVKDKIRIAMSGKNGPGWKGGLTKKNSLIRNSAKYKEWRKCVLKRDSYTCQLCGIVGGQLNVDHIKSFAYYPELRFDLDNGRTLCVPCHKNTPNFAGRAMHELLQTTA